MIIFDLFSKANTRSIGFIRLLNIVAFTSYVQQLRVRDFVLFGGSTGVDISSASNIHGGSIGSFTLVKTSGNLPLGNIIPTNYLLCKSHHTS